MFCFIVLAVGLEEAGIKVWVDVTGLKAGVDFLSKIGQAIIDATVSDDDFWKQCMFFPLKRYIFDSNDEVYGVYLIATFTWLIILSLFHLLFNSYWSLIL